MIREAVQMSDPCAEEVPEHHGQRLANPGEVHSLQEEGMASPVIFQVREIKTTQC